MKDQRAVIATMKVDLAALEARNGAARQASDAKLETLQRQARELQEIRERVDKQAAAAAAASSAALP